MDPRLSRLYNRFYLHGDRSAIYAERAADPKLARLRRRRRPQPSGKFWFNLGKIAPELHMVVRPSRVVVPRVFRGPVSIPPPTQQFPELTEAQTILAALSESDAVKSAAAPKIAFAAAPIRGSPSRSALVSGRSL